MRRLRPVVLTALTTILGLVPTVAGWGFDFRAFRFAHGGESSQWWRPMGVAVMFGLAFATFLTLVLVPVLYDLLLGARERLERRRARKHGDGDGDETGTPREEDREIDADTRPGVREPEPVLQG